MASSAAGSPLVVISWPGGRARHRLDRPLTIGRDPEADIAVDHARLSRIHCRLAPHAQGIRIQDLGSSNGTTVDGAGISQVVVPLDSGCVLGGVVELTFREPNDEPVGPPVLRDDEGLQRLTRIGPSRETAPRGGRSQRSHRHRAAGTRRPAVVIAVSAGLLLAVLVPALPLGEDVEEVRARRLAEDAAAHLKTGRVLDGLQAYERLAAELPQTRAARSAQPRLEEARALARQREALLSELEQLVSGGSGLRGRRLLRRGEQLLAGQRNLLSAAERSERAAAVEAAVEEAARVLARRTTMSAQQCLQSRFYGAALERVVQAQRSPDLVGSWTRALETLHGRVVVAAASDFGSVLARLKRASGRQLRSLLLAELPHFDGTVHMGELRARLRLQGLLDRGSSAAAGDSALLRPLIRVEDLAARRRFREAANAMAAVLDAAGAEAHAILSRRQARLWRIADALDRVIADIARHPRRFERLSFGKLGIGRVLGADHERLRVRVARGDLLRLEWADLPADRVAVIADRCHLDPASQLAVAELLLELEAREAALAALSRAWPAARDRRERIQSLVAEGRGMDAVPSGGFLLEDGRFLTQAERRSRLGGRRP